jgi:H+-transporting ATPase
MGTDMYPGDMTRLDEKKLSEMKPSAAKAEVARRNELVMSCDGFGQVLPRDKREVVMILKDNYSKVVGMTGDGVNDAPALSAAQCGIAVDGATDAAKNAAAIILTTPGLSAIYGAVLESRRIFLKLKSFIIFQFAITFHFVIFLSALIYISACPVVPLHIIIFTLLNDITLLPIAYDRQHASKYPIHPNVNRMLIMSAVYGTLQAFFSIIFVYGLDRVGFAFKDYDIKECNYRIQSGVWLQMSMAAQLSIFSTRAPSYLWRYVSPIPILSVSVFLGNFVISILANQTELFGNIPALDIFLIWVYDFLAVLIIDCVKVQVYRKFNENTEVITNDIVPCKNIDALRDSNFSDVENVLSQSKSAGDDDDDSDGYDNCRLSVNMRRKAEEMAKKGFGGRETSTFSFAVEDDFSTHLDFSIYGRKTMAGSILAGNTPFNAAVKK